MMGKSSLGLLMTFLKIRSLVDSVLAGDRMGGHCDDSTLIYLEFIDISAINNTAPTILNEVHHGL